MSDTFSGIAGNEELIALLRRNIAAGALAHAYTLEGPDGSGKTMLAYAVAAAVSGPEFAEKVRSGNSADVKLIAPENGRRSVSVDDIRAVKADAALTPNELDCRFYIFDDAQNMSPAAQNTLLKILEEPPAGVYFLLLCTSAAGLLPTVRSRAPVLRMELLDAGVIRSYLLKNSRKAKNISPEELDLAVRMSHGTIGSAIAALSAKSIAGEEGAVRTVGEIVAALRRLSGDRSDTGSSAASKEARLALYSLMQKFPSDRSAMTDLLEKTLLAARDLLAVRLTGNEHRDCVTLFYPSCDTAAEAAGDLTAQTLSRAIDIIEDTIRSLSMNVNVYTAQTAMLTAFISA